MLVVPTLVAQTLTVPLLGSEQALLKNLQIVAKNLFNKALDLLKQDGVEVLGTVKFIHQYLDMSQAKFTRVRPDGTQDEIHGCLPSMGGGVIGHDPILNGLLDTLSLLTPEDAACQAPKKIFLNSGRVLLWGWFETKLIVFLGYSSVPVAT